MSMKIKTSETSEVFINLRGLLLLFILLFVVSVSAQDKGKDILDAVQKKYKSINDLSADFKQSTNGKASLNGKIFFSKGNKLRLELENSTIISDGTVIWNYNKGQKKVVINNPSAIVITNDGVGKLLSEAGIKYEVLENKIAKEIFGIELEAHDCRHEEIFEEIGQVQNTGFFIDKISTANTT